MRHFRAIFGPLDPVGFDALSFEALDVFEALGSLAALNCRNSIQLWCEGRYFGRFERIVEANASYWRLVSDVAAAWLPPAAAGIPCSGGTDGASPRLRH